MCSASVCVLLALVCWSPFHQRPTTTPPSSIQLSSTQDYDQSGYSSFLSRRDKEKKKGVERERGNGSIESRDTTSDRKQGKTRCLLLYLGSWTRKSKKGEATDNNRRTRCGMVFPFLDPSDAKETCASSIHSVKVEPKWLHIRVDHRLYFWFHPFFLFFFFSCLFFHRPPLLSPPIPSNS